MIGKLIKNMNFFIIIYEYIIIDDAFKLTIDKIYLD